MYFKRLEIHGFKSFAEPSVIDFNEGITAIVGPNGSGKSNISDAIRWVLGEQSAKELRGGKMEEVIFNGTENRRAKGMAEVTLVIDNTDQSLNIDYNEVAITRRMFRSGESEYLINNHGCRLKDIRNLFVDTGIGVDGYSIIGQGKIADIISDKPASRRKIFEESAGIVAYKNRKAEAEKKLEETKINLDRIDDIVQELEGRITGLRTESQKAKQYLELKKQYRELSVNIILKNIKDDMEHAEQYKTESSDLAGKINFTEDNLKKVNTDALALENKEARLIRQEEDAHKKIPEIVESIGNFERERQLRQERQQNMEKEESRIQDELSSVTRRVDEKRIEVEESRGKIAELNARTRMASNTLEEKKNAFEQLGRKRRRGASVKDLTSQLYDLHSTAASKKSESKSVESYKSTLEKRKRQLNSDSEALLHTKQMYENKQKEIETSERYAQNEKQRLEKELSEAEKQRLSLQQQRSDLESQLSRLQIRISEMTSRQKTIEEMEHSYEGYSYAVRYIMQSGLIGVEGVAGDMIDVPDGMETAIETALGAAKQNIIIRDEECAKRAVNVLKHNKAGRLTFLPVSSIEGKNAQVPERIAQDAGFMGLAVDLVKFRERYRSIFRYLLGRVAVVDNLDAAIRLSKIRGTGLRYVTLDGEVINAGGAITGGVYRRKTANVVGRKNEIARLQNDIEQSQDEMNRQRNSSESAEHALKSIEKQIHQIREEQRENDIRLTAVAPRLKSIRDEIRKAEEQIKKNDLEVENADKELRESDEMARNLLNESKDAEQQIVQLEHELEKVKEEEAEMQTALQQAREEVSQQRIEYDRWNAKLESEKSIASHGEKELNELIRQQQEKESQADKLAREKSHMSYGTADDDAVLIRLQQEKQTAEELISQSRDERKELSRQKDSLEEQKNQLRKESAAYRDEKYQLEIKAAKNETQLEHLKDRLFNDFELSYAQALDMKWDGFVLSGAVKMSNELKDDIRKLGEVNVGAIDEYEKVSERYKFLSDQQSDVQNAASELEMIIEDMDHKIIHQFTTTFQAIRKNFTRIFKELFGGGDAELILEDEKHPMESGIQIISRPPGKKLQNINLLSGGEKTMTALALMFAVLCVKPTPFCILDEVEAALDEANIARFAEYLKNFHQTQFALITHQKATMEHADSLYGVTMAEEGVSKVISLKLGEYDPDDFTE
ncbi:MAG: chromosome segregation protein SMC [Eubacterium sp.]|jgi:chromosome segregation protein